MTVATRACLVVTLAASTAAVAARQSTSTLSGIVVAHDDPRAPVARAVVTLVGGGLTSDRATITDGDGRFSFTGLPAGRFTLTASKTAWISMVYGARRPGRPGTPIILAAGGRANVTIPLVRGATLTGTIRDHAGDPAPGVTVMAMPVERSPSRTLTGERQATTDDGGVYRIYGLTPGDYVLTAANTGTGGALRMTPAQIDALLRQLQGARSGQRPALPAGLSTFSTAPFFYPGTPVPADAEPITLAAGDERTADLALQLARTATIEGIVSAATTPLPPVGVALTPDVSMGMRLGGTVRVGSVDPEGRFKLTGVLPGRYTLRARSVGPPGPAKAPRLFGSAEVNISGDDVSGLVLALKLGLTMSGRVVFDAATTTPPSDISSIRVRLDTPDSSDENVIVDGVVVTRYAVAPAQAKADGTFEVTDIMPGTYRLSLSGAGPGWWLRSAMIAGRDALDGPIEIAQDGVSGVVVTYADRRTILNGTLQTSGGAPVSEYFVIVFPSDRSTWRPGARRIQSTRPATDGKFTIRDLPAGEYFIAALTDFGPEDLNDPRFLEQVIPASLRVTIADGETRTQNLRLHQ